MLYSMQIFGMDDVASNLIVDGFYFQVIQVVKVESFMLTHSMSTMIPSPTCFLLAILRSPMTRVDLPLPLLPQMATFCRGGMSRLRPPEFCHTLDMCCIFLGLGKCLIKEIDNRI